MINYAIETKKIIKETNPSKHNPTYDASMYWSQKAYNVADGLISLYTKKGDVIFDPFLGSGVTLIESVSDEMSRKAIGCEINDEPIFLINSFLKKRKVKHEKERLALFLKQLDDLEERYYVTTCPGCGATAVIKQVIFDKTSNGIKIKKINFNSHSEKCKVLFKDGDAFDYENMIRKYPIFNIQNIELIPNSKLAVKEGMHISDLFTNRNFKVLDEILELKKEFVDISDLIDYVLVGIIHLSKITDTHSNSQWPLWTPYKDCVEKNVISIFKRRAKKVLKAISFKETNFKKTYLAPSYASMKRNCGYIIFKKGVQNLKIEDVPDESVDFILTDPPYLGQVAYSEYMQLYKPFLDFAFNLDDEIIVSSSPKRSKDTKNYFSLMEKAFKVCSQKLKPSHYMCMYFHDCNLAVWNSLITIMEENGLKYLTQVHVDKTITLKNIISPKKSLNGDSLLVFQKINNYHHTKPGKETITEIEENLIREAKHMILVNGPQTTPELYDNGLMEIIIANNWLETLSAKYKTLVEIFEKYLLWDSQSSRWCLNQNK